MSCNNSGFKVLTAIIQQRIDGKIAFELFYKQKKIGLTLYVECMDNVSWQDNVIRSFLKLR
ncbi:hypothetical protein [Borrelia turicatae]|uniref:hypothetical protein n=1 Tax=Borrelia turicatae TaxID=142 RepID=UPI002ED29C76